MAYKDWPGRRPPCAKAQPSWGQRGAIMVLCTETQLVKVETPTCPIRPSHKQLLLLVPMYLSRASLYKDKGIEIYISLFCFYYTKMEHIVHTLLCSSH